MAPEQGTEKGRETAVTTLTDVATVQVQSGAVVLSAPGVHLAITGLLAIIGVVGVVVNVLLIVALLQRKSRRVTSNLYLVNLAVGELCNDTKH